MCLCAWRIIRGTPDFDLACGAGTETGEWGRLENTAANRLGGQTEGEKAEHAYLQADDAILVARLALHGAGLHGPAKAHAEAAVLQKQVGGLRK